MDKSSPNFVLFAKFLLRVGLALSFLYAGVSGLLNPSSWVGFFPFFLRKIFDPQILLFVFSVYEIILALVLLWGRYTLFSASLSALTLFFIIILNLAILDIVFRDIGLFFASLALVFLSF
jgi:uncharacterized membrane protein YphA (DoxX/SURF4 family)